MSTAPKCLQCGKALRQGRGWVDRDATPAERETFARIRAEHQEIYAAAKVEWENGSLNLSAWDKLSSTLNRKEEAALKQALGAVTVYMHGKAVVREQNGRFGYDGEGRFCSLRCGFDFATLAAIAGYRRRS